MGYHEIDFSDLIGVPSENITEMQLDGDRLMEEKDIDFELADFLALPASAQGLDRMEASDKWKEAWQHVCSKNTWLVQRTYGEVEKCLWCTICGRWADVQHLNSSECRERREKDGQSQLDPLLNAILTAAHKSESTDADDFSARASASSTATG